MSWLRRGAALTAASIAIAGCGAGDEPTAPQSKRSDVRASERPPAPAPTERPASELKQGHSVRFPGRLFARTVDHAAPDTNGALLRLISYVGVQRAGGIRCMRLHLSLAGPGLCLRTADAGSGYEAVRLDRRLRPIGSTAVEGLPSRARVSRDGRYGAYSVLTEGTRYSARPSDFSTATRIVDMRDGSILLRLEQLDVRRGNRRLDPAGAELWSVTFGSGGRFYATLAPGPGSERLLVSGRVGSRRADVIAAGVENPDLSPDGTQLAYRRRIGDDQARWRFHVRALDGSRDVRLAEPVPIDDQPEWLGRRVIAYSDGHEVLAVQADGRGKPSRLSRGSTSPAWLPGGWDDVP